MSVWSTALRHELRLRARSHAGTTRGEWYESLGNAPAVLFATDSLGREHGNFELAAFTAILANPSWRRRLDKPHQRPEALPSGRRAAARELDSCNSSDALAMNVFCHPGVCQNPDIAALVGFTVGAVPEFGVPAHVPLANGPADRTEIDARIGSVLAECKLTEADFTSCPLERLASYRDVEHVFEVEQLSRSSDARVQGYQIIRNILAAHAMSSEFRLICDARRPDLLREYWTVVRAIRSADLRRRCGFVLWQELAALAPPSLRTFLANKYGLGIAISERVQC